MDVSRKLYGFREMATGIIRSLRRTYPDHRNPNPVMKRILVVLSLLTFSLKVFPSEGSFSFQPKIGVGHEPFLVFGVDPQHPEVALNGGSLSDYAARPKLEGEGYSAELWYGLGAAQLDSSLRPLTGARVGFDTGSRAGLPLGLGAVGVPGTLGGDHITLQLRVWDNMGGTVQSWEAAQNVAHGKSDLVSNFELGGVDATGAPVLGDGNLYLKLTYFGLAIPEPSLVALGALGLALFRVSQRSIRIRS